MPLAALTSIRIQIHPDTFVNKLGTLDIAEPVEQCLRRREPVNRIM